MHKSQNPKTPKPQNPKTPKPHLIGLLGVVLSMLISHCHSWFARAGLVGGLVLWLHGVSLHRMSRTRRIRLRLILDLLRSDVILLRLAHLALVHRLGLRLVNRLSILLIVSHGQILLSGIDQWRSSPVHSCASASSHHENTSEYDRNDDHDNDEWYHVGKHI